MLRSIQEAGEKKTRILGFYAENWLIQLEKEQKFRFHRQTSPAATEYHGWAGLATGAGSC